MGTNACLEQFSTIRVKTFPPRLSRPMTASCHWLPAPGEPQSNARPPSLLQPSAHVFSSDCVDLVNNTTFANSQTLELDTGDIDTSWSRDCRVFNNISVASHGKTVHRTRNRENKPEASNMWQGNVLFADGEKKVRDFSERDTRADPLIIAPAPAAPPASFGSQPGSPARGAGIDGPLVIGQVTQAIGSPAQRVLRVAPRGGLHQGEQRSEQSPIFVRGPLAPSASAPDARVLGRRLAASSLLEFAAARWDGALRNSRASRHSHGAAKAKCLRFGSRPKPSEPFIKLG